MRRTAIIVAIAFALGPTLHAQLWSVTGSTESRFGEGLAIVGDTNGDGIADVLVGAPGNDVFGEDAGRIVVLSGLDGAQLLEIVHTVAGDNFGVSCAGPGDLDGDGLADLLVGAYRDSVVGHRAGRVYALSGVDGSVIHDILGPSTDAEFGIGVAALGDLDGDGVGDFAVGAHHSMEIDFHSGSVRVYSGASATLLQTFLGDEAIDDLGHAVDGAGDVNADGVPDILGGLHDSPEPGQARVYCGVTGDVLIQLDGTHPGDFYGRAVAGVGDVDGDGHDDILVGAPVDDGVAPQAGRAELVSGATGLVIREWSGAVTGDQLGIWVADAGDFDGDGCRDQILSLPGDDAVGQNSGTARIVSGWDGSALVDLDGLAQGLRFGVISDGGVDLDGDGGPDVVVSYTYDDLAGVDTGRVVAWPGALPTWTPVGPGLAGVGGAPVLAGKGLLATGVPGELALRAAAPGATCLFLMSVGSLPAPFKGGTLFSLPIVLQVALTTDGAGELTIPWAAWPSTGGGVPLVFQFAVADGAAAQGVALSNAVQGLTKP